MSNHKKNNITLNIMIISFILIILYVISIIYFSNHFFIGTYVNGVNISCNTIKDAKLKLSKSCKNYVLTLEERNEKVEQIYGEDINYKYNDTEKIQQMLHKQKAYLWILEILNYKKYEIVDLFIYDKDLLKDKVKNLDCFQKENIIEPLDACFRYDGSKYVIVDEVLGNKVNEDYLYAYIVNSLSFGLKNIDLEKIEAYETPTFISSSEKVIETYTQLNKYVSTNIYYIFDNKIEVLDGSKINQWLEVDQCMNIVFNEEKIKNYVNELSRKYDTFGKSRDFKTSTGKIISVVGGNYGWKINKIKERESIIDDIKEGKNIRREPIYSQIALGNRQNDIGNTYVEINLTTQSLWFYKEGKLITQGDVVTGNVSRGFSTPKGTYVLNYKQKNATLKGAGYSSDVKYWMPFNCNIGIHDANWRGSFGGSIYKNDGSHGCVNAPLYLAKKIFENIEPGTPIICYSEE